MPSAQRSAATTRQAVDREASEQEWQMISADFAEGTRAMLERRVPVFIGA